MITRLKVSNYRSLAENIDLRLDQLTVLVGPNGSGKSNLVDIPRFVSDCMHLGLEGAITRRHGIQAIRRWTPGHPFNFSISISVRLPSGGSGNYSFELKGDRQEEYQVKKEEAFVSIGDENFRFTIRDRNWISGPEDLRPKVDPLNLALPLLAGDQRFQPLADVLRSMVVYSIFPQTLREPQKYDPARPMEQHGANWVSILKDQSKDSWKNELLSGLGELTGDIQDLRLKTVGGYLLVQFRHQLPDASEAKQKKKKSQKWFDAAQESDGTLRFAGMITALLQEPPLSVIGIEEPELTVHPGALPMLYDFIQQATKRSQVILTTHSPDLLDLIDAESVWVVEKRDGVTTVAPMSESQRHIIRNKLLTLGEVFKTEGLQQELSYPKAK